MEILTFWEFVGRISGPWRISVAREVSEFKEADGQSNYGGFIELAGDCRWKW